MSYGEFSPPSEKLWVPEKESQVYFDFLAKAGFRPVVEVGKDGEPDRFLRWEVIDESLTAAAAPLKPPRSAFERPEPDRLTPWTILSDGSAFGHLASWEGCHTGFTNQCIMAPRSASDYSYFHVGAIETEEGDQLPIGKIVYGGSHVPISVGMQAAAQHYDKTASVGAFVRATNGRLGPWLAGVVKSDLTPEGLRDLRANPLSGDWRPVNRGPLELIAALAVPVQGFPIPRAQLAISASADGEEELSALILPGVTEVEEETMDELDHLSRIEFLRERDALVAAVLTTKTRKALPKTTFAIPERRAYPMPDRSHAANAIARSRGTADAERVQRFACKKFPDLPSCD